MVPSEKNKEKASGTSQKVKGVVPTVKTKKNHSCKSKSQGGGSLKEKQIKADDASQKAKWLVPSVKT